MSEKLSKKGRSRNRRPDTSASNKLSEKLDPLDLGLSREEELQLFLDIANHQFKSDTTTAFHAFEALNYVSAFHWGSDSEASPSQVTLPFWIIETIAHGFLVYRDSGRQGRTTTFGEAFGMEGGGQGKSPKTENDDRLIRDIRIALCIALKKQTGQKKVTEAITELAMQLNLSEEQLSRIWKSKGTQARAQMKRLLEKQGQDFSK